MLPISAFQVPVVFSGAVLPQPEPSTVWRLLFIERPISATGRRLEANGTA
jgi:hypothetical protein